MLPRQQQPEIDEADSSAFGGNLLAPLLGLLSIGMLAGLFWSLGLADRRLDDSLSSCASIADGHQRLACYDKLPVAPQSPGKGAVAPSHTQSQKGSQ